MRRTGGRISAAAAGLILLATCTVFGGSSRNPACDAVGSAAASEALRREVQAKPSPIEGFFFSCEYYLLGTRKALAGLSLYEDEASRHFDADRADFGEEGPGTEFLDEDIGVPAYLSVDANVALAGALDGDRYFIVDIFVDRYGETPGATGEAAVRLLQAAVGQ